MGIAPASDRVAALARSGPGIRIWGAPATIALYALTGGLIGMGRTRGVLVLQLVQSGVTIGPSVWLVIGLLVGGDCPGFSTCPMHFEPPGVRWSGKHLTAITHM